MRREIGHAPRRQREAREMLQRIFTEYDNGRSPEALVFDSAFGPRLSTAHLLHALHLLWLEERRPDPKCPPAPEDGSTF